MNLKGLLVLTSIFTFVNLQGQNKPLNLKTQQLINVWKLEKHPKRVFQTKFEWKQYSSDMLQLKIFKILENKSCCNFQHLYKIFVDLSFLYFVGKRIFTLIIVSWSLSLNKGCSWIFEILLNGSLLVVHLFFIWN